MLVINCGVKNPTIHFLMYTANTTISSSYQLFFLFDLSWHMIIYFFNSSIYALLIYLDTVSI